MSRLRVLGQDGAVIWDGTGETQISVDPAALNGIGSVVLRLEADGHYLHWDISNLLTIYPGSWAYEYSQEPLEAWEPNSDDLLRIPEPPRVVSAELVLDMPAELALCLREELTRSQPQPPRTPPAQLTFQHVREAVNGLREQHLNRRRLRELFMDPLLQPGEMTMRESMEAERDEMRRRERGGHPYEVADLYTRGVISEQAAYARMGMAGARAVEGLQAMADEFEEQNRLMEETRAAFPPDPYQYGRRHPEGPSRWTPPEDPEEKIRSCP